MDSQKRFVLMLAGTQAGKTVLGSWWMLKEIVKQGRGDYLVATPTYPLMSKKVLPEFRKLFENKLHLGSYRKADKIFELSDRGQEVLFGDIQEEPTQIFFGHAQDPDSLESATAKAAWLDEAGQKKFRLGSWEAIQRRLSIYEGRVLITTTPYTLGWLKTQLHDKALANPDGDIELIQFDSIENPFFPRSEYNRMSEILPSWKFNMMYRGIFERPAGMIYDCFDAENKIKRFAIPQDWPRFLGIDFGGVNTAATFIAKDPLTGKLYAYKTYHKGGRTAKEHARHLLKDEGKIIAFGGAKSEGQWRDEFLAGGLPIHEPTVSGVEVGIDRVYELFKTNKLQIFDDLVELIDDIESYSRVLDENNDPTEEIEDKSKYHLGDSLRYIATFLNNKTSKVRRHHRGGRR